MYTPEDCVPRCTPHRRERAARAFARPRRGAPAGPSRIGPKRARPLPERQLVRRADRSAPPALHDQPASAAPCAWPSSRYRYGSPAAARPAPRPDPDGCRDMLGPVIALGDAVRASVSRHGNESALYRKMAVVPERMRRRHPATYRRAGCDACRGGPRRRRGRAGGRSHRQGGRQAEVEARRQGTRNVGRTAPERQPPAQRGREHRRPGRGHGDARADRGSRRRRQRERHRHGHRRRQDEPAAETDATGSNDAAGGDTREEAAGADGGTDAAAGTEGSEQAAE